MWENKTLIVEKQMKGFQDNSRRIEDEVFILYMLDHELVIAFNLQKIPILSILGMEYLRKMIQSQNFGLGCVHSNPTLPYMPPLVVTPIKNFI